MIQTSFWSAAPPETVFHRIASTDAMKLFRGGFLVPGIVDVVRDGRRLLVLDSWGWWNEEIVASVKRPENLLFHIRPNPFLRLTVQSLLEEWKFLPGFGGTWIFRSFSPAGKTILFQESLLREAIEANNEDLRKFLLREGDIREPLFEKDSHPQGT